VAREVRGGSGLREGGLPDLTLDPPALIRFGAGGESGDRSRIARVDSRRRAIFFSDGGGGRGRPSSGDVSEELECAATRCGLNVSTNGMSEGIATREGEGVRPTYAASWPTSGDGYTRRITSQRMIHRSTQASIRIHSQAFASSYPALQTLLPPSSLLLLLSSCLLLHPHPHWVLQPASPPHHPVFWPTIVATP
jgi:hypothetical protein